MSIQLLPSNLIFRVPRDVIGMLRCKHAHTLSWLDVYISPIKIILWVVTGCGMLVIAQWYKCSITSFFLENETKNPAKKTGTKFKFQYLKNGLQLTEYFYSSSDTKNIRIFEQRQDETSLRILTWKWHRVEGRKVEGRWHCGPK